MKRRQTIMLRVSGWGLGLQASERTLTQLTSQRTDPKNKKQLLGLPRSTYKETNQSQRFALSCLCILKTYINPCLLNYSFKNPLFPPDYKRIIHNPSPQRFRLNIYNIFPSMLSAHVHFSGCLEFIAYSTNS